MMVSSLSLVRKTLIVCVFLAASSFAIASSALGGRKVIVRFAVTDTIAITDAYNKAMGKWLQKSFPDHVVLTVKVYAPSKLLNEDKIRAELLRQVSDLELRPGDQITHLDLYTHGSTKFPDAETSLKYFGKFGPKGADANLHELLAPLKPYISPDLVLVQNSCLTLCGTSEQAAERSEALLRDLGAPHGQIYGAVTYETEHPTFPRLGLSLSLAVSAYVLGSFMVHFGDVSSFGEAIAWAQANPLVTGVTLGFINIFGFSRTIKTAHTSYDGNHNVGRLIRFRDGKVEENVMIAKRKNFGALYSRSACARLLK